MIKYDYYLKNLIPYVETTVVCNNCKHELIADENYHPRFCDMCGAPIKDNLSKVIWRNEIATCEEYAKYMVDNYPNFIIRKIKYECTEWGRIGLPKDIEHIPVFIGKDMTEILKLANYKEQNYFEEDFEPASKQELIEFAKTCKKQWITKT